MNTLAIFGLQLFLSLTVYSLVAKWYVFPWLEKQPLHQGLMPLIFPHALRHVGLAFLVPGLVVQPLPSFFATSVAYGDLVSGVLALLSLVALRARWGIALAFVWLFNIVGTMDLLNALRQAEAVPDLGTTWYIPTFWVPILLVTHGLIFVQLTKEWRHAASHLKDQAASI